MQPVILGQKKKKKKKTKKEKKKTKKKKKIKEKHDKLTHNTSYMNKKKITKQFMS